MKTDIQSKIEKKVIACGLTFLSFRDGVLLYGNKKRSYKTKATKCDLSNDENTITNNSWFLVHIDPAGLINDLPWSEYFTSLD